MNEYSLVGFFKEHFGELQCEAYRKTCCLNKRDFRRQNATDYLDVPGN